MNPASGNDIILNIVNLSVGYEESPVVNDISLHVRRGEIVALAGKNGSGKTTLLRALSHRIESTGRIEFCGEDISDLTSEEIFCKGLVHIPEECQLFDRMSVEENLLMDTGQSDDRTVIAAKLEKVYDWFPRLAERRRQCAGSLSDEEQQICIMGRALMASPILLLVDEMRLGLAPAVVGQLVEILQTIRKTERISTLLVEQDIHPVLCAADRGYVLKAGKVIMKGTASRLIHHESTAKPCPEPLSSPSSINIDEVFDALSAIPADLQSITAAMDADQIASPLIDAPSDHSADVGTEESNTLPRFKTKD